MPDPDTRAAGWLLVLCGCLALWQPLNLAVAAATALQPFRFGLAARPSPDGSYRRHGARDRRGCGDHRPRARQRSRLPARRSFCRAPPTSSSTPPRSLPNNRMPGDTPLYVAWTIAFHALAMDLSRSKRVRETLT